jgi:putative Mg2+ transporter-C (MgtC) family protein
VSGVIHVGSLRLELLLELAMAVLLGGTIGLERELRGKPAGLRTNILICMAAVLFTDVSYRAAIHHGGDPGRIAAQILTGVGFIGAGTIIRTRGSVVGLTSAATIWVVTAIGIALGSGAYLEALGTTLLVMLVLAGLGWVERRLEARSVEVRLLIEPHTESADLDEVERLLRDSGLEVERRPVSPGQAEFVVRGPRRLHRRARRAVRHHPAIRRVSS